MQTNVANQIQKDFPAAKLPIRVLLVDDSALALEILRRMLNRAPEIEVVGTARNGEQAMALIPSLRPDVICTDYHMPGMDGIAFIRCLMESYPCPVLVASVSVQAHQSDNIFRLLDAGALDVIAKPRGGDNADFERLAPELISKIRILAGVHVFRHAPRQVGGVPTPLPPVVKAAVSEMRQGVRMVAIGASTGGPPVLLEILSRLPADFPAPIVCVQHISAGFLKGLVDWLGAECSIEVRIARSWEIPQPGIAYFAPEDMHLAVGRDGTLICTREPPCCGHRPSVNVMMHSVAQYFGAGAVGILLSGIGEDGAEGLREIAAAGGVTYAQSEATSAVFGMPKAAIDRGAARFTMSPDEIAVALLQSGMERGK